MAQELLNDNPAFYKKIQQVDAIIQSKAGWSIIKTLRNTTLAHIADTTVAQPLIMSIQIAITSILKEQGISPINNIGHSVGEVAAAYSAECLSLEQAIDVILARSNAQEKARKLGGMAAIEIGPDKIHAILRELSLSLEIAGYNSASSLTLAGKDEELQLLKNYCQKHKILCKVLDLEYPFHSSMMECAKSEILTNLNDLS